MADGPIYWEARQRGKKVMRGMHKPSEGGDKCEGEVAKGLTSIGRKWRSNRRSGKRKQNETRDEGGEQLSFWTYLKVNGCRGCQKQEEEETIHHVISGGCEGIGKKENSRYREEMRVALQKSKKLMRDIQNSAGVIQMDNKALRALQQPRRQANQGVREDEEQALRQMISGTIPEWQEASDKEKGRGYRYHEIVDRGYDELG
eukprot:6213401-Pleurochrysis_carterae.AAC.1